MDYPLTLKNTAIASLTAAMLAAAQGAVAHTRLQISQIDEGTRVYNNEVIGHGCKDPDTGSSSIPTLGTVLVFPDGVDSSITVDGEASADSLADYVSNWGSPLRKVQSDALFKVEDVITDPNGNTLGYWAAGGARTGTLLGLVPFRTEAIVINPESCAETVKFIVSIADVCKITDAAGFSDATVMLWTPAVGSIFDGPGLNGHDSPASLTVKRTSELPEACGGSGVDVVVTPSAAQLNRDMPVKYKGVQVWPKP